MDLYPRRRNVAAQVAEELKMATYATPLMEEHRKEKSVDVRVFLTHYIQMVQLVL